MERCHVSFMQLYCLQLRRVHNNDFNWIHCFCFNYYTYIKIKIKINDNIYSESTNPKFWFRFSRFINYYTLGQLPLPSYLFRHKRRNYRKIEVIVIEKYKDLKLSYTIKSTIYRHFRIFFSFFFSLTYIHNLSKNYWLT